MFIRLSLLRVRMSESQFFEFRIVKIFPKKNNENQQIHFDKSHTKFAIFFKFDSIYNFTLQFTFRCCRCGCFFYNVYFNLILSQFNRIEMSVPLTNLIQFFLGNSTKLSQLVCPIVRIYFQKSRHFYSFQLLEIVLLVI